MIAPTATDKGYTLHTCERCEHSYKDNYTENKNDNGHKHSYATRVVAPTCTEKGYTVYTCACGDTYKGNYKEALGHKYTSKVIAPTTESQGYTLYTCERCRHSYKDNYTAKLVTPEIKCAKTIRYGETLYVNLKGIKASNLLISNRNFVSVENISDSRVAITLTEDVDGYITITDSVSRVNVVIDIVSDESATTSVSNASTTSKENSSTIKTSKPSSSATHSQVASSNETNNTSSTTSQSAVEEITPEIKCAKTIRYGETLFVNLKGIEAAN